MENALAQVMREDQGVLLITWNGYMGTLPDPIPLNLSDDDTFRIAEEAVRNGDVPGIPADPNVRFRKPTFLVDQIPPGNGITYARVFVRNDSALG